MNARSPEFVGLKEKVRRCALFEPCSDVELDGLLHAARSLGIVRGKPIYQAGDPARDVYLLLEGGVKLSVDVGEGRLKVVRLVYPVSMFGLLDAFGEGGHELNAVAIASGEMIVFDAEAVIAVLKVNARFSVEVIASLSEQLRVLTRESARYNQLGAREKVAAYLVEEARSVRAGSARKRSPTRRDIASLLGIAPETLSRELGFFKQKGLLRVETNGSLHVVDTESLESLVEPDSVSAQGTRREMTS
jgi:CRP-like cAMP-binding protein